MYLVELYLRVRRACMVDGMSVREASRVFGVHRKTVRKMLENSVPPGYRIRRPRRRRKLERFTAIIDRILRDDLDLPRKQRHIAKRIHERLRDEHGFDGGYTTVKDYVRERRLRTREMFVPLVHSPGHPQCDFGEAWAVIGGLKRKAHYFVLDLPRSDAMFAKAYPAETTEAFCDGHVSAFSFLGGVPQSIVYDNTKLAVAKILGDGRRRRIRVFTELQSHYLFTDRFGRPGKGNDKGKVEGMVKYVRRNFLVPTPDKHPHKHKKPATYVSDLPVHAHNIEDLMTNIFKPEMGSWRALLTLFGRAGRPIGQDLRVAPRILDLPRAFNLRTAVLLCSQNQADVTYMWSPAWPLRYMRDYF